MSGVEESAHAETCRKERENVRRFEGIAYGAEKMMEPFAVICRRGRKGRV